MPFWQRAISAADIAPGRRKHSMERSDPPRPAAADPAAAKPEQPKPAAEGAPVPATTEEIAESAPAAEQPEADAFVEAEPEAIEREHFEMLERETTQPVRRYFEPRHVHDIAPTDVAHAVDFEVPTEPVAETPPQAEPPIEHFRRARPTRRWSHGPIRCRRRSPHRPSRRTLKLSPRNRSHRPRLIPPPMTMSSSHPLQRTRSSRCPSLCRRQASIDRRRRPSRPHPSRSPSIRSSSRCRSLSPSLLRPSATSRRTWRRRAARSSGSPSPRPRRRRRSAMTSRPHGRRRLRSGASRRSTLPPMSSRRPPHPRVEAEAAPARRDSRDLFRRAVRVAVLIFCGWFIAVLLLIAAFRFINPPFSMLMALQFMTGTPIHKQLGADRAHLAQPHARRHRRRGRPLLPAPGRRLDRSGERHRPRLRRLSARRQHDHHAGGQEPVPVARPRATCARSSRSR